MTGARAWFVGVDVGGTFTDVVLADSAGGVSIGKVPTTPDDPPSSPEDPPLSVTATTP